MKNHLLNIHICIYAYNTIANVCNQKFHSKRPDVTFCIQTTFSGQTNSLWLSFNYILLFEWKLYGWVGEYLERGRWGEMNDWQSFERDRTKEKHKQFNWKTDSDRKIFINALPRRLFFCMLTIQKTICNNLCTQNLQIA